MNTTIDRLETLVDDKVVVSYVEKVYDGNILIKIKYLNENKQLDRKICSDKIENDEPSVIAYYKNGNIMYEDWYRNGNRHRDGDLPAYIEYYDNKGLIYFKSWWKNNEKHRDGDKPAYIQYDSDSKIIIESWWKNNEKHRASEEGDLPAHIEYNSNGDIVGEYWYQDDRLYRNNNKPVHIKYNDKGKVCDPNSQIRQEIKNDLDNMDEDTLIKVKNILDIIKQ